MASSPKVFITGASGYVGAHVLQQLLNKGYSVRVSVRSQFKADQILSKYPQHKSKLEFVIVEDIGKEGVFEGKLDGVEGVFHIAAPFTYEVKISNRVDLLDPAVNSTTGVLEASLKVPTIKRVVITSSFAAMFNSSNGPEHVYSESDWNPVTMEQAENYDAWTAYFASKTFAEKAAFDFVHSKNPSFDIVALNPPFIYGPLVHHIDDLSGISGSLKPLYEVIKGKPLDYPTIDVCVDVRDVATAHILAYEKGEPNQRYFIVGDNYSWKEVADVAHKYFPGETKAQFGPSEDTHPRNVKFDNSKSKKLGLAYHHKENTFKDTIMQLLEFEQRGMQGGGNL